MLAQTEQEMCVQNFNFNLFDLSQAAPATTRSSELTVKVWVRRHQEWMFLLEETVNLRLLNFIGTLRNQHFPSNCLVFHLIDGIYSLELPRKSADPKQGTELRTSSYSALMKLSNLDASIQDALATRDTITAQINEILARTPPDEVPQAQEKAGLAQKYVAAQQRAVKTVESRRDELRRSIAARKTAIAEGRAVQARAAEDVDNASSNLAHSTRSVASTGEQIRGQRRRICEDLSRVFPISPSSSGQPLCFEICGLYLPNTDYDPTSAHLTEDGISAALGHVAQLTHLLQLYLGVPLPYPIAPFGSRSSIRDDISQIPEAQRTFPLFSRGGSTAQYRFDYGWFLLNKDIEALCASTGLKVVDIRHTLPNLKYLLYVCSAGTDELPERKRGGVRGLWASRMKERLGTIDDGASSIGGSRRGSVDSDVIGRQRDELHRALGVSSGDGGAAIARLQEARDASSDPVGLPFDEGAKLTLRTKGMRENVVR
jgi:UV radiation resistance-associated gene protein